MHDLEAQTGGSAGSSLDDLPLALLPSFRPARAAAFAPDEDDVPHQHDVFEPLLRQDGSVNPSTAVDKNRLRSRRLGWSALHVSLLLSIAAMGFYLARQTRRMAVPRLFLADTAVPCASSVNLSSTSRFLHAPSSPNHGLVPFPSSAFCPLLLPRPLRPTQSTSSWPSPSCLETFVSSGTLCPAASNHWTGANAPKVDVVWTWVNGSSAELMADWRNKVSEEVGKFGRVKRWLVVTGRRLSRRASGASVVKHFREHDELRFSIRSVLASFPAATLGSLHLVVGDTPAYSPSSSSSLFSLTPLGNFSFNPSSTRLAQVPHWASFSTLDFANLLSPSARAGPRLWVHPHSELFKVQLDEGREEEANRWQNEVLPSFNSLAIESQLANLDVTATTALYLNDDFFLMQPLVLTDLSSPLTGPVFRMQRDLLVSGVPPADAHDNAVGEWRSLGYTAWLLNQRFGKRRRPYLVHVAKAMDVAILGEVQKVFGQELTATAASRFRGQGPKEVHMLYLVTMYTIEKHREALLWSFLVARSDTDRSGGYSPTERRALLTSLGYTPSPTAHVTPSSARLAVPMPQRASLASLPSLYAFAGLPPPNQTSIEFTSADEYAFIGLDEGMSNVPPLKDGWSSLSSSSLSSSENGSNASATASNICTLDLVACFGDLFLFLSDDDEIPISPLFHHIAFEQPQCGDCLIALLMGKSSEKGVKAFLPAAEEGDKASPKETQETNGAEAIALEGTRWEEVDFVRGLEGRKGRRKGGRKGSLRRRAATLIHRYAYTIGSSPASFQSIRNGGPALTDRLNDLSHGDNRPAFVALNDDLATTKKDVLADVDSRMKEWFEGVWPAASPWEQQVD